MKISVSAACTQIRNVTVCGLLTFTLAACGAGSQSSSSGATAAAADSSQSLVLPNVGMIDRTPAEGADVAQNTTPASNTTTPSEPPAPASDTYPVPGPSAGGSPSATTVAATGTATLDWTPPIQNTDGSVLTDLAGYTVYYGTSPGNLSQSVKITNPGLTAYTMSDLPSGTWYFAISSYSAAGVESARSVVISTRI